MKIDVYADIVCPWCYIGHRRLGQALADFPGRDRVALEYRPYQLDPSAPADAVPLVQYLQRRFGQAAPTVMERVATTAAAEHITINWESAVMANTLAAHRLLRLALGEHGAATQRLLLDKLFAAHFTDGLNLGNADTLAGLAAAAGMSDARSRTLLAGSEGLDALRSELAAAQRLGVQAVPTFVFNERYVIQGAQPTAVFLAALREGERGGPR